MGTISTGVGLISGIDTASLIDSLITLEAAPQRRLEQRVASFQAQQSAFLDINARLLSLQNLASGLRLNNAFRATQAGSSDEDALGVSAGFTAAPGRYDLLVQRLASASQRLTRGFATAGATPVGLSSLAFELGNGRLDRDTDLAELNGGQGVRRGDIVVTDTSGASATIDLGAAVSIEDVVRAINDASGVAVTATVSRDGLVITDDAGEAGTLSIQNAVGSFTASDLGIALTDGSDGDATANGVLVGSAINTIGGATALGSLNDGNGVLVVDNNPDFTITARDGSVFEVDLGRVDDDITAATLLEDLNDGSGVDIGADPDEPDLQIVDRDGTTYDVFLAGATTVGDLQSRVSTATGGRIAISVTGGDTLVVTDTVGGSEPLQVLEGAGETAADLGILNETGAAADSFDGTALANASFTPAATTLQEVVDRINAAADTGDVANGGRIVASIAADGVSLQIEDTTTGSETVIAAGVANPSAAASLGIEGTFTDATFTGARLVGGLDSVLLRSLNGGRGLTALTGDTRLDDLRDGAGLTTSVVPSLADIRIQDRSGATYDVNLDDLETVQDLIDAVATATGGAVTLSIEGQTLVATNAASGTENFEIIDINGGSAAAELGLAQLLGPNAGDRIEGDDVTPSAGTLDITDRSGAQASIDLSSAVTVQEVIDLVNAAGLGVQASLNDAGNGLRITDTTGATASNLIVTGDAAAGLRLAANVAADEVRGGNAQVQYVADATRLEDLNYGRGVGTGSFRITDGFGGSAVISIGSDSRTVHDVVREINGVGGGGAGLKIQARVNDTGDGIVVEPLFDPLVDGEPSQPLRIETVSGSTAADLGLVGTASGPTGSIDGSYERVVELNASDTLQEIVERVNDAGLPVQASILNTGGGPAPYRLTFSSEITGRAGDLVIDTGGVDLGLTTLTEARDAVVFFGSEDPATGLLITSSSNQIDDAIEGVTLDLRRTTEEAVSITIDRDVESIVESVGAFVAGINDVIDRVDTYDRFDIETEERGVLLGEPVTARLRAALLRAVQAPAEGVESRYQRLSEVGIRVGSGGRVDFDEERLREAYAEDPLAVESLFVAFEQEAGGTEEIAQGVTVQRDEPVTTVRGFGQIFADLAESYTDSIDGTLTLTDQGLQSRIDLANDRIADLEIRLEARRLQLQTEFAAMESALAQLQGQNDALVSLTGNLALAQGLSSNA